ncbi:VanZ family protein [Caldicoprobacter faecalis]|uniref:VanZ family protein n=1 Tax=Caldicoprobacter faecalis TaxID=937334 RepID=UPI00373FC9CE
MFFVIKYTQFPIILNDEMRSIIGQNVFRDSNFLPFANLKYNLKYIILNTVMTIPFGFGICFLIKTSFKKVILLGFGLGFSLELMQLIIALIVGFTFRYVDVNDIIFNTCGAVNRI